VERRYYAFGCMWDHDPFVPATIALCSFIMEDNEVDACIGQI